MPNVRRLSILTDGVRIELETNEVSALELRSIAQLLLSSVDESINSAASVKGPVLAQALNAATEKPHLVEGDAT
jgi:hypothetical protein